MSESNSVRKYVSIWAVLLVALFVSLGLGEIGGPVMIAVIFVIAAIKALLVLGWFMHLAYEPWHLRFTMVGALAATLSFTTGVYPDVGLAWSVVHNPNPGGAGHGDGHGSGSGSGSATPAPTQPPSADRGAKVYDLYCKACHQEDGKGNNGVLAANFVDDKERMAQADEVLLGSIKNGKNGKIGAMPPWGSVITPQQQVDVLKYIRVKYTGAAP